MIKPDTPPPSVFVEALQINDSETPIWLQNLLGSAIVWLYETQTLVRLQQPPGESCTTISMLLISLLRHYGVKSRFAVGSARWQSYPIFYQWKGVAEYHSWVMTEYGEIVDLACGALNTRSALTDEQRKIRPPRTCWEKLELLADRDYVEVEDGHAHLNVDCPGEQTYDLLYSLVVAFCAENRENFAKNHNNLKLF
jgi:hypothetical protein